LRNQMQQMELLLPQFQEACEQQVNQHKRKAVVATRNRCLSLEAVTGCPAKLIDSTCFR